MPSWLWVLLSWKLQVTRPMSPSIPSRSILIILCSVPSSPVSHHYPTRFLLTRFLSFGKICHVMEQILAAGRWGSKFPQGYMDTQWSDIVSLPPASWEIRCERTVEAASTTGQGFLDGYGYADLEEWPQLTQLWNSFTARGGKPGTRSKKPTFTTSRSFWFFIAAKGCFRLLFTWVFSRRRRCNFKVLVGRNGCDMAWRLWATETLQICAVTRCLVKGSTHVWNPEVKVLRPWPVFMLAFELAFRWTSIFLLQLITFSVTAQVFRPYCCCSTLRCLGKLAPDWDRAVMSIEQ